MERGRGERGEGGGERGRGGEEGGYGSEEGVGGRRGRGDKDTSFCGILTNIGKCSAVGTKCNLPPLKRIKKPKGGFYGAIQLPRR